MEQELNIQQIVDNEIIRIKKETNLSGFVFRQASTLFTNGQCQMLTQSKDLFEFSVDDEFDDFDVKIAINGQIEYHCNCKAKGLCHHKIASLYQLQETLSRLNEEPQPTGKAYTREGMIKRVMEEREDKALKAAYKIAFADNKHGEHILSNEKAKKYKITFRDINTEIGYCSCPDYQTNKLGTCKHLMYAFKFYKNSKQKSNLQQQDYPFIEIFTDPLNDYKITWYYPHKLPEDIQTLINKYFKAKKFVEDSELTSLLGLIGEADDFKKIKIRPEVIEKIERAYNKKLLKQLEQKTDFDNIIETKIRNASLFHYQKEGVRFAVFKEAAVIADEMGLGKTIQAITIAVIKKELFDFKKAIVICPASLKEQWKNEIERFSNEKATIIGGNASQRKNQYNDNNSFFVITNYEAVMRDIQIINQLGIDFMILDEAQRIKNYSTQTYSAVKSVQKKHALIITGTPIENKLLDLYSIVNIIDDKFLTPLWEFSYQYCYFDQKTKNKITGYYNLNDLKQRLSSILIRREKKDVLKDLPNVSQIDIPIELHQTQRDYHSGFSASIARILSKKFITAFDMQNLMNLLTKMRMVCDSTYLIDLETNFSPKLEELEYILVEKMDLKNKENKVIIFSEWKKMNLIIGKMLRDNNIGFVELNGSVPVAKRGLLIKEFETNSRCKIFISTEAGSTGLNLQVADTVINFELPWNPAKKNQRIGRIDRIGQLKNKLTVLNFVSRNSIESKIALGLILKQNLFESVLSPDSNDETIDFSSQGRSQFLNHIEEMLSEIEAGEIQISSENIDDNEIVTISEETKNIADNESNKEKSEKKESADNNESEKPQNKNIATEKKPDVADKKTEHTTQTQPNEQNQTQTEQLEQVMNHGLGFISGLFKMATGQDLLSDNQSIHVDKQTGEVTMKFKLPIGKS